jgi:hypothetical protein
MLDVGRYTKGILFREVEMSCRSYASDLEESKKILL